MSGDMHLQAVVNAGVLLEKRKRGPKIFIRVCKKIFKRIKTVWELCSLQWLLNYAFMYPPKDLPSLVYPSF